MRFLAGLIVILFCVAVSTLYASIPIISPLTFEVAHCKKILLAKYLYHNQDQHYFLAKEFDSAYPYQDTIIMHLSSGPFVISETSEGYSQSFALKDVDEYLIFTREGDLKGSKNVSGNYYINFHEKVYTSSWSLGPSNQQLFLMIQEAISWPEFLERIKGIQKRMSPLLNLKDKPKIPGRNKFLLSWLNEFTQNNYDTCGWYEDCGWGNLDQRVITWLVTSGDIKDAWIASQYHRQIEVRKRPHLKDKPTFGLYEGSSGTYTSKAGISFLLKIALNENLPMHQRNQALVFLSDAVKSVYACSKTYPYECKVRRSALQESTFKKIIPLLQNPDLNYYALLVYQNLCKPLSDHQIYPMTKYKFDGIVQLFKEHQFKDSDFRYVLAILLAYVSTPEEWKSMSGNENNLLINLSGSRYDSTYHVLNFYIKTNQRDPGITEIPKIKFERIVNGQVDTALIKQSIQFYKPPLSSYDGGKEMRVNVSDLPPGIWHYVVFGVAGKEKLVPWTSVGGTFVKE